MSKILQELKETYCELNDLLGEYGKIVIAGGAVRDALMDKPFKDIDVFMLNNGVYNSWGQVRDVVKPILTQYTKIKTIVEWHKSEPFLIESIK